MAVEKPLELYIVLQSLDPLNISSGYTSFMCPHSVDQLVDFPDMVNHEVEKDFKAEKSGVWVGPWTKFTLLIIISASIISSY